MGQRFELLLLLPLLFKTAAWGTEAIPPTPAKHTRAERRAEIEKQLVRLKSEVWAEREAACDALRGFGPDALPQLTSLETGGDAELAWRSEMLIKSARMGGENASPALAELLKNFSSQAPEERAETIHDIVRKTGAGAVPVLLGLLNAEDDTGVLAAIVERLSYLSPGKEGLKPLLKLYDRAPEELKGQVLQALAAVPSDESRAAVRGALEQGEGALLNWAVNAAARLNDRGSLPALRKLAEGGEKIEAGLQVEVIRTLAGMLDYEAAPLFRKLLDGSHEIQTAALNGLAGLHDRAAAPKLLELLGDPAKSEVHELIVDCLGPIGDPSFVPVLREKLKNDAPAMRISAINALRQMDAKETAPELDALLEDSDLDVQYAAAEALSALGYKQAVPRLRKLAASANVTLQHQAAKALANLGEAEGLKLLMQSAKRIPEAIEEGGDLYRAANEAVYYLGQWQVPEARELLRELAHNIGETAWYALYQFNFDTEAFRAMLKERLAACARRPGRVGNEINLAIFLKNRGLDDMAVKRLEKIVRLRPDYELALDRLASSYHEAGRYAESEAAYARLEALGGVNATYFNNRAWFHCTAFSKQFLKPELALSLAQRAVAMSPRETYIVDTLGWSLHASGKFEDAVRELRRALELKDGADRPGRAWQRTRIARSLAALGRKTEADAEVTQALQDAPQDARVLLEAAGYYAATGRRDEGVDALHKAIDAGWIQEAPVKLNPEFDALREDPGYAFALRRVRLAREAIERLVAEVEAEVHREIRPVADAGHEDGEHEEEEFIMEGDGGMGELFNVEDE